MPVLTNGVDIPLLDLASIYQRIYFTACRSFAAFCKLSEPTGSNCRQLSDKIRSLYISLFFSWMGFGSGNFRAWRSVVFVEWIMKEISAVSAQLASLFATATLKLYNLITLLQ